MTVSIEVAPLSCLTTHPEFQYWVNEYIEECRNDSVGSPLFSAERYEAAEKAGTLRVIIVTDGHHLAGAAVLGVTTAAHYEFPLVAADSLYLRKPWRKGRTGLDLLGAAKAAAVREGAPGLVFMAPPDSMLDRLCARLGMVNTHKVWWCKA